MGLMGFLRLATEVRRVLLCDYSMALISILIPILAIGLLWCLGWTDKPGDGGCVSIKPAHRYKMSVDDFREAERKLLASNPSGSIEDHKKSNGRVKGQASLKEMLTSNRPSSANQVESRVSNASTASKRKTTIDSFFQRKSPKV